MGQHRSRLRSSKPRKPQTLMASEAASAGILCYVKYWNPWPHGVVPSEASPTTDTRGAQGSSRVPPRLMDRQRSKRPECLSSSVSLLASLALRPGKGKTLSRGFAFLLLFFSANLHTAAELNAELGHRCAAVSPIRKGLSSPLLLHEAPILALQVASYRWKG
jgi:hypothetical protein